MQPSHANMERLQAELLDLELLEVTGPGEAEGRSGHRGTRHRR